MCIVNAKTFNVVFAFIYRIQRCVCASYVHYVFNVYNIFQYETRFRYRTSSRTWKTRNDSWLPRKLNTDWNGYIRLIRSSVSKYVRKLTATIKNLFRELAWLLSNNNWSTRCFTSSYRVLTRRKYFSIRFTCVVSQHSYSIDDIWSVCIAFNLSESNGFRNNNSVNHIQKKARKYREYA